MMRNLKVLGTALAAVLVLGAAFASFASAADDLTAEKYPVKITGNNDPSSAILKTTAGSHECTTSTLTATLLNSSSSTPSLTVTPDYSGCTCLGVACTIDMNGCDYTVLMIIAETKSLVIIHCTVGNEITLTSSKCVIHIPAQENLGTITWKNIGAGATREVTGTIAINEKIKYSHTEGSGIGKCTTGSGTTGSLTGSVIATGEEDTGEGKHIGLFFS